jgi:hypothetical protein
VKLAQARALERDPAASAPRRARRRSASRGGGGAQTDQFTLRQQGRRRFLLAPKIALARLRPAALARSPFGPAKLSFAHRFTGSPHFRAARPLPGRTPTVFIAHSCAPARTRFVGKGGFSLKDLLLSAFASVGLTAVGLWVAGRFLGEKLFGHWLEGRLQRQKQEHAIELEQLKNEQNRQIEMLRGDIGHLQDRGKHSNEREYAALTGILEKYAEFHVATDNYIRGIGQSASAESAHVDFRVLFDRQNVFIPKSLTDSFDEAAEERLRAMALRAAAEAGLRPAQGLIDEQDFLEKSRRALRILNDAVRDRLHRG